MIVKIGEQWFNSDIEPIMVILTNADKENIASMSPDATQYCSAPDNTSEGEMEEFMHFDQIPREAIKFTPLGDGGEKFSVPSLSKDEVKEMLERR